MRSPKILLNLVLAACVFGGGMATLPALGAGGSGSGSGGGGGAGGGGGGGGGGGASQVTSSGSPTPDTDLPGELMVKLRSTDALAPLLAKYPLTLLSRFGSRPIYRLKVVGAARLKEVLASLLPEPQVMVAETNPPQRSPEARRNLPWAVGTPQACMAQWAPQAMHLGAAKALTSGVGVRVAMLDTGVDRSHPCWLGACCRASTLSMATPTRQRWARRQATATAMAPMLPGWWPWWRRAR